VGGVGVGGRGAGGGGGWGGGWVGGGPGVCRCWGGGRGSGTAWRGGRRWCWGSARVERWCAGQRARSRSVTPLRRHPPVGRICLRDPRGEGILPQTYTVAIHGRRPPTSNHAPMNQPSCAVSASIPSPRGSRAGVRPQGGRTVSGVTERKHPVLGRTSSALPRTRAVSVGHEINRSPRWLHRLSKRPKLKKV